MASPTDIAWAAGLFEGEGCFHPRRQNTGWRAALEMSISMTDLDALERFQSAVNAGTITPRKIRAEHAHYKPQHTWRCSGIRALEIAAQLEPYLCSRRLARLNEIREFIANSQPKPRVCECCQTTFTPTRFDRERYCSTPCRDRGKYLNRKYGTTSLSQAITLGYVLSVRPELRTHCRHNHELVGANVLHYTRPTGQQERRCRACGNARYLARKAAHPIQSATIRRS